MTPTEWGQVLQVMHRCAFVTIISVIVRINSIIRLHYWQIYQLDRGRLKVPTALSFMRALKSREPGEDGKYRQNARIACLTR